MASVMCDAFLRDRITGKSGVWSYPCGEEHLDSQDSMWREGNWSCDCNRSKFLYYNPEADRFNCSTEMIACDKVVRRDTGEVLYAGDDSP